MNFQRGLLLQVLLLAVTFMARPSEAGFVKNYKYPYKDPVVATVSYALLATDQEHPESIELPGLPERNHVPRLGHKNTFGYTLFAQDHRAPLVVMIPGLGGSEFSGPIKYVGEYLYNKGYHVVGLSSPFFWRFVLTAGTQAMPGIMHADVSDLEQVIRRVLYDVQSSEGLQYTRTILMGFSMGALQAAHLAAQDEIHREFGWDRVILLNPPVDISYGLTGLDQLLEEGKRWSRQKQDEVWSQAFGKLLFYRENHQVSDADYFLDLREKMNLPESYLKFAMGLYFREALKDTIYTTQQIYDLGLLRNGNLYDRSRRMEAKKYSFSDYMDLFLIPTWKRLEGVAPSPREIKQRSGLRSLENYLRRSSSVYLMHNQDDFLLRSGDVAWLEDVFGRRSTIYPLGGHLGNLWYPSNLRRILHVLEHRR